MKAARVHSYGPPEAVIVEDVPEPVAGEGEVLVAVSAAAINFPDLLMIADKYQVSLPLPFTCGSEFAGVVLTTGPGVDGYQRGDRVIGSVSSGAFAERVVAPVRAINKWPVALDAAHAAGFRVTYRTAYHALRSVAVARPGDWVAVLGAAGGVGTATIDVAKALGCRVLASAGGGDKTGLCRVRGADAVIDYTSENLKDRMKELTGGGPDVVIDPVGGPASEQALRACRWGARFVTVGFAAGDIPRIPLNIVLLKGVIVKGLEVRTFALNAPELAARDERELIELADAGKLVPHVSAIYPLGAAAAALRAVADRTTTGKVVLSVADDGVRASGFSTPHHGDR